MPEHGEPHGRLRAGSRIIDPNVCDAQC